MYSDGAIVKKEQVGLHTMFKGFVYQEGSAYWKESTKYYKVLTGMQCMLRAMRLQLFAPIAGLCY